METNTSGNQNTNKKSDEFSTKISSDFQVLKTTVGKDDIDLNNTKKSETKVQKTNRSNVEPTSQFKISYTKQGRNYSNFVKE